FCSERIDLAGVYGTQGVCGRYGSMGQEKRFRRGAPLALPFPLFTSRATCYTPPRRHPPAPVQGRVMDKPQQPNGHTAPHGESLPGFFPLRLLLQPSGALIELSRPDMVIGRHTGADVRLPLPDVSRRHCRCLFIDGTWHILDLSSLNGVWVNETPVQQA